MLLANIKNLREYRIRQCLIVNKRQTAVVFLDCTNYSGFEFQNHFRVINHIIPKHLDDGLIIVIHTGLPRQNPSRVCGRRTRLSAIRPRAASCCTKSPIRLPVCLSGGSKRPGAGPRSGLPGYRQIRCILLAYLFSHSGILGNGIQ